TSPGLSSDSPPLLGRAQTIAEGTGIITESIFENRFKYVDELAKMGAFIKVEGNVAVVSGGTRLTGANLVAPDLRAGAALVLAGLAADGVSSVDDIQYILRGYENFDRKLRRLGAEIELVKDSREAQKFRLRVG
ncbi:MAG: UDP-N-acetylglucosamine 1-carboxyvinyltransferase, partial [Lachnospiraceae bacterium]|nr:UDP-N-acetylglucosamine 1-carboxyvinyltransferase [Lachnospiraceae bacterium]